MIGGGVDIFDGEGFVQFRLERGGKLGASVGGEVGGDAEPGNPPPDEGVGARRGGDVLDRYCLWPS